jgi:hypothetical protein
METLGWVSVPDFVAAQQWYRRYDGDAEIVVGHPYGGEMLICRDAVAVLLARNNVDIWELDGEFEACRDLLTDMVGEVYGSGDEESHWVVAANLGPDTVEIHGHRLAHGDVCWYKAI